MKDTDKLRQSWLLVSQQAEFGPDCPDAEEIWAALEGDLQPPQIENIILHTAQCPACAELWRLAHSLEALQPRKRYWFRILIPVAVAASLVLVLGWVGFFSLWPDSEPEFTYRTIEQSKIQSLTPETAPMVRDACWLKWAEIKGARYSLRVTTTQLQPLVHQQDLRRPEFLIPKEFLENVAPGSRLLWQVTAYLPQGGKLQSQAFFVTLE